MSRSALQCAGLIRISARTRRGDDMAEPGGKVDKVVVMITTPLEQEFVDRISAVDSERVEVICRPDLMPPTTYLGDHTGPKGWSRTPEQEAEWRALLAG